MKNKPLTTHACWAGAALLAFGAGSLQRSASSAEQASASRTGGNATAIGELGSTQSALPSAMSPKKGSESGRSGEGSVGLKRGNWRSLALDSIRSPNPLTRRLAFSKLLEGMTADNAFEIREHLVELGADAEQWREFSFNWGALAGEEAFMFASESKERDMEAALAGWASANPDAATAMLDSLPENLSGQRDALARSVIEGLSSTDRSLATDLVLRLAGEGIGKPNELMQMVANSVLRADSIENAAFWSESLPDGAMKAAAMERVASNYVRSDPAAAAAWAGRFADQDYATRVIAEVGEEWAEREPVEAVGWLETLPEGEGQRAGLSSAFGDWEDRDPASAALYLTDMPVSDQRDAAISGFSRGYAWQDPETAIAWAQDISDPSLRQRTLARAGYAYHRRDPNSARAWLPESGLPAEMQQRILNGDRL